VQSAAPAQNSASNPPPPPPPQALYNAYMERELVSLKDSHPGLKLSQYKERIFDAWKKSPENPANSQQPDSVFGMKGAKTINTVDM